MPGLASTFVLGIQRVPCLGRSLGIETWLSPAFGCTMTLFPWSSWVVPHIAFSKPPTCAWHVHVGTLHHGLPIHDSNTRPWRWWRNKVVGPFFNALEILCESRKGRPACSKRFACMFSHIVRILHTAHGCNPKVHGWGYVSP